MPTGISWTDETWVPVTGCTRVSPACDSCYAFTLHDQRHVAWKRGRLPNAPRQYHQPFSTVQMLPDRLHDPLHWKAPRKVFLTSMGDLFHEDVPVQYLYEILTIIAMTPQHTYQVLTKRPDRMARVLRDWAENNRGVRPSPMPNLWAGTTVENQATAAQRILWLLETPAAVRFLSCEPLLGPLDLTAINVIPERFRDPDDPDCLLNALTGHVAGPDDMLPRVDWVIIGGESGPRYREMDQLWFADTVQQCRDAGVAVWVKQDSGRLPGKQGRIPDELFIREFPQMAVPV